MEKTEKAPVKNGVSKETLTKMRQALYDRKFYKPFTEKEGYKYRYARIENINRYEALTYERVNDEDGNPIKFTDKGGNQLYLMAITEENKKAVDSIKKEAADELEAAIDPNKRELFFGDMKLTPIEKQVMRERLKQK